MCCVKPVTSILAMPDAGHTAKMPENLLAVWSKGSNSDCFEWGTSLHTVSTSCIAL